MGVVSVTNHAGFVMSGELTSVTNGTFTLNGRRMPLRILPVSEQTRVKRLAGCDMRTPAEKRRDRFVAEQLKSIDLREKAGQLTSEEAEKLRESVKAAAVISH